MKYMLMPLRRYFDFHGRSRRLEFWLFVLFNIIIGMIFAAIFLGLFLGVIIDVAHEFGSERVTDYYDYRGDRGGVLDFSMSHGTTLSPEMMEALMDDIGPLGIGLLVAWSAYAMLIFIPMLAVQIRRLHDSNRTGWWAAAPTIAYLFGSVAVVVAILVPELTIAFSILGSLLLLGAGLLGLVLIVFMFLEGTRGPNRFGPDPKAPDGGRPYP